MKYSITIPAYKARFLSKCIDSILAQTYKDFELIIVNDASPEDLDSIVNSYSDKRIRYYTNEVNCGAENVVDNWNKCLSYASGDYIICMGDDDELSPDCLEQYNQLMAEYPDLDLYHARVKLIDENSEFYSLQESRPSYESVYSMIWHQLFKGRIQYIGDFLFKRTALISNGGFYKIILAWGSDFISAYIAAKDTGVANTQTPTFYYRINSLTISSSGSVPQKIDAVMIEFQWYKDFLDRDHPSNEIDTYYYLMIKHQLSTKLKRKILGLVTQDVNKGNIFRLFYWLRVRKRILLSFSSVMHAYIKSFKC